MNVHRLERIRRRYIALHEEEPVGEDELEAIESALRVKLPPEVMEITTVYSGGILGGIEHAAIESSGPAESIVSLTSTFRAAIGLPQRYLVLADHSESVVVMDVESGVVTWLDAVEVQNLVDGQPLVGRTKAWPSYTEFFEFMLDEEERERGRR